MNKKEYLSKLKDKLSNMDAEESKKYIRTYRIKINTLVNEGMSEEDAIKSIGSIDKVYKEILKKKEKKEKASTSPKKKTASKKSKSSTSVKKSSTKKVSKPKESVKKETKSKKERKTKEQNKKESLETKKQKLIEIFKEKTKELKSKNNKEKKEKDNDKLSLKDTLKKNIDSYKNKRIKKKNETPKKESVKKEKLDIKKKDNSLESMLVEELSVKKSNNVTPIEEELTSNEEIKNLSTTNVIISQMTNLICLLLVAVLMYFPFNLINSYGVMSLAHFGVGLSYIYGFSVLVYLFYLIVCLSSFAYYFNYIVGNKKSKKINLVTQKIKRISMYILVVPCMALVVLGTMMFIISCFFYLDGLRVKGMPVAFFGIFIFICMIYTTLRNKLLNKEKSMFYSFFMYLIPLLITGAGLGLCYKDIKKYEVVYNVDEKYQMKSFDYEYSLSDDELFRINFNTDYNTMISYKEDKKLKGKVRVTLTYYKDYYEVNTKHDNTSAYISLGAGFRRKLSIFLENIKDNKIYELSELERYEVIISYNPSDKDKFIVEN